MSTPIPPRLPAGERIRRAGIAAWSIIGIVIVVAGLGWLLMKIRIIFPPLLVALVLIYLLNPAVSWLGGRGVRRGLATLLVYVLVFAAVAAIVFALVPVVTHQVAQVAQDWPDIRAKILASSGDVTAWINGHFGTNLDTDKVRCVLGASGPRASECGDLTSNLGEQIRSHLGRIIGIGTSLIALVVVLVIGVLVSLYLMIDLPQLRRDVLGLIPDRHRAEVADVAAKVGQALGGFFRGQLLVALIVGVLSALGFWIIGLPLWFFVGALAGFFNLIPMVGPFIGGGIGFLVGVATGGVWLGVQAALVELAVQQLDNHVISPNVIGRSVKLHPVTVMLSLLAGGTVAGFWGVFLAVPAVAAGKIVLYHVWVTRVLGYQVSPYAAAPRVASPPSVIPAGRVTGEVEPVGVDAPGGREPAAPPSEAGSQETKAGEEPEAAGEPGPRAAGRRGR